MTSCTASVPDKNASGDNLYGSVNCNQVYIDYFWKAYGFNGNKAYWENGWGWDDACNTDLPLARAFNGCYLLTYSAQNYQDDSWSSPILNWGRRYVRNNISNLRPYCGDGSAIAQSFGSGLVKVYLGFFYTKTVPGRAETLIHESRHQGGKPHDATFPKGSAFGEGKSRADSSWGYQGAWMFGALYLWWFYAAGARTTSAMGALARQRGNLVIDNAFATHPGFSI